MTALLTQTPTILDPANYPAVNPSGPYRSSTGKNFVGSASTTFRFSPTNPGRTMYKIAGTTYTLEDPANQPEQSFGASSGQGLCTQDKVNDKLVLTVKGTPAGSGWAIQMLDCATELWQPQSVSDGDGNTGTESTILVSNGDVLRIFYDLGPSSVLYYRRLSGGSWSGRNTITLSAQRGSVRAAIDSADRVHIFWVLSNSYPTPNQVWYTQMDGISGAVTISASNIYTLPVPGSGNPKNDTDVLVDNVNGTVSFMTIPFSSGTFTDHIPRVVIGTPLAAPVFTASSPDPTGSTVGPTTFSSQEKPCWLGLDTSGNTVAMWFATYGNDPTTSQYTHVEVWMNTLVSGTWGTPTLVYDLVANPPPGVSYATGQSYFSSGFYLNCLKVGPAATDWVLVSGYELYPTPRFQDMTFFLAPTVGGGHYTYSSGRAGRLLSRSVKTS